MNLISLWIDVIKWLRDIDSKVSEAKKALSELKIEIDIALGGLRQIRRELAEIKSELKEIALAAGDIRIALPLIREIHDAVIPEEVALVKIFINDKETSHMDIEKGQSSNLTYQAFGKSGNPTVARTAPAWTASDTTNFAFTVAGDTQSAQLVASGDPPSAESIGLTVDGIAATPVTFAIVAEAVASVVISASTPA